MKIGYGLYVIGRHIDFDQRAVDCEFHRLSLLRWKQFEYCALNALREFLCSFAGILEPLRNGRCAAESRVHQPSRLLS